MVFSILFDEKYFVYRSITPNFKKNNGIKGFYTLMKVTGGQLAVLRFLGFFSECLRAKIVRVSYSHFNSQGCQSLLLKESEY